MRLRLTGLWHHADFMKLWTGQAISAFGSQITFMALPLTAALVLEATPVQMGYIEAVGALPTLLLGLFVGVWVDHFRRRPMLIAADFGRATVLLIIPIAALVGALRIEYLYVVAFLVGIFGLFFGVANRSYLPALVGREQLIEGNSKLEMSRSVAEITGPGVAGWLVQLVTAPIAILVDSISFLLSAFFLSLIRTPEPAPKPPVQQQKIWGEIGDGLKLVFGDRLLRAIAGSLSTVFLFNSALEAIWILYITRELEIGPSLLGLAFASGSVGFLIGALLSERVTRRFGLGRGIIGGLLLVGFSDLLTPLLVGSMPVFAIMLVLIAAQFFFGLGLTVYNIGQVSVRQGISPDHLQGRMNATVNVISWGVAPLGGLLGGMLGELFGLRTTLFLAALGEILSVFWLLFSPMWGLREQPAVPETLVEENHENIA